jgi:hypothetical protein
LNSIAMRRLLLLLVPLALAGATTVDMLDGPSPAGPPPSPSSGGDSTPAPGLLDGGILRDGSVPPDGMAPPLDGRATPS